VLASWNTIQVLTETIQEKTTQRRGRIDYQDIESERNELKTVNQIRYFSASITCQKNIPVKTTLQID
jgi:hypothetical protein